MLSPKLDTNERQVSGCEAKRTVPEPSLSSFGILKRTLPKVLAPESGLPRVSMTAAAATTSAVGLMSPKSILKSGFPATAPVIVTLS